MYFLPFSPSYPHCWHWYWSSDILFLVLYCFSWTLGQVCLQAAERCKNIQSYIFIINAEYPLMFSSVWPVLCQKELRLCSLHVLGLESRMTIGPLSKLQNISSALDSTDITKRSNIQIPYMIYISSMVYIQHSNTIHQPTTYRTYFISQISLHVSSFDIM